MNQQNSRSEILNILANKSKTPLNYQNNLSSLSNNISSTYRNGLLDQIANRKDRPFLNNYFDLNGQQQIGQQNTNYSAASNLGLDQQSSSVHGSAIMQVHQGNDKAFDSLAAKLGLPLVSQAPDDLRPSYKTLLAILGVIENLSAKV
jgi:hypothetical protein